MKMKTLTHSSVLILSAALSTTAFGSGFALNEQSARLSGQAFAGRASDADNASTLMTNPAGMSFLKHAEVSFGAAFVDASSDFSNVSSKVGPSDVIGTNDGDMIPFTTIPSGYYVQPINNHLAVGFGVYAPFGLATEHEDSFQGRYFGTTSDIQVVTYQPTISVKLGDHVALGLGITYNRFDGKLEKNIRNPLSPTSDINAKVKGDDDAWGYNLGVIFACNDQTRIGLTYYSKVKYTLEGHTTLEHLPTALGIGTSAKFDAELDIETPDRIDLGITHDLTSNLTLHGQIARTNWSTLDEIRVENDTTNPTFATSVEPLDWGHSMMYALGLSYKLNPQWALRGGIALDEQPIPNETRSVRLPAGDRKIFSLGTTWTVVPNLDIDLAYMYLKESSVEIHQSTRTLVTNAAVTYDAKVENKINILSLQGSWRF